MLQFENLGVLKFENTWCCVCVALVFCLPLLLFGCVNRVCCFTIVRLWSIVSTAEKGAIIVLVFIPSII